MPVPITICPSFIFSASAIAVMLVEDAAVVPVVTTSVGSLNVPMYSLNVPEPLSALISVSA